VFKRISSVCRRVRLARLHQQSTSKVPTCTIFYHYSSHPRAVLGTLAKLPGNNPVQSGGTNAVASPAISPLPKPSASPTSNAGIPSYQVLAPSVPASSKPSTRPSQASGPRPNVSESHTHASYTPVVTPHIPSNDNEDCGEDHHSTPAKPHHTPSSVASHKHPHPAGGHSAHPSSVDCHKHSHSAGDHSATPSTDCSHPTGTPHHGSGSNGGSASPGSRRKRTSSSQERRSTARHVARSPNAGHRFMKYRPRTF